MNLCWKYGKVTYPIRPPPFNNEESSCNLIFPNNQYDFKYQTCISFGNVALNIRVCRTSFGGIASCSTMRRIWGSKPMSSILSASSNTKYLIKQTINIYIFNKCREPNSPYPVFQYPSTARGPMASAILCSTNIYSCAISCLV